MPPPPLPDLTGQVIASGRLELLELLGSGSFGAVYKARDTRSHPPNPAYYAVKCLPHYPEGTTKSDRQLRELLIQRRCAHSNIITIQRVYVEGAFLFVVLDYCAGGDLFRAINNNRFKFRNNDALVKTLFIDVLNAVEHCHQLGFAHRDLKLENILLDKDMSKAWLGDFGLACSAKISTNYGCGSKPYMSPECFSGNISSPVGYSLLESDIWSLGVILTNMISGHPPWLRPSVEEDSLFRLYLRNPTRFLRRHLRISSPAVQILLHIFQLDPQSRPSIALIREEVTKIDTFFLRPGENTSTPDRFSSVQLRSLRSFMKAICKASVVPLRPSRSSGLLSSFLR